MRDFIILLEAVKLGFIQEKCLEGMHPDVLDFANNHIGIVDVADAYLYLFEKVAQYAEAWICKYQKPEFVKEIYYDLHYKRSFTYQLSNGSWGHAGGVDLIDWGKYKDCKDDDKIFFCSVLDSDNKTVLKFFDYGSKRHQL